MNCEHNNSKNDDNNIVLIILYFDILLIKFVNIGNILYSVVCDHSITNYDD